MKRSVLILLVLLLTLPTLAKPNILVGQFIDLEFGDYAHVQIRDNKGKDSSFFLGNDPSLEKFVTDTDKYRGKRVRVHWHTITKDIPQAGGPMEIEEAFKIEVLD